MIKKMLSIIMCVAIVMSGSTSVFAQRNDLNDLYEILSETIIIEENGILLKHLHCKRLMV